MHQKDVADDIAKQKVKDPLDFKWQQQLRFYFDPELDDCMICCADQGFVYQYEFLGCAERLVITPLTDRCYVTLTQALGMYKGGAPAGPAGTGKTETTKDLARAMGKYCVVTNCGPEMVLSIHQCSAFHSCNLLVYTATKTVLYKGPFRTLSSISVTSLSSFL